jgi:SAM-dependent methyltransferase
MSTPIPTTRDLDDPQLTEDRRAHIRTNPFLRRIYQEWYDWIVLSLPEGQGAVLEIGSGPGFLKEIIPSLITSDLLCISDLGVALDAQRLPFKDDSLRGIVMTNTLHHIPQPRLFFAEACRCLRPGGVVSMIEPWVTTFSRLVYHYIHHEPFTPNSPSWEFPSTGPLSGANQALPWMVFSRDRTAFENEFPDIHVRTICPDMPFVYLLSGGLTAPSFLPAAGYGLYRKVEDICSPLMDRIALFAHIVLEKR